MSKLLRTFLAVSMWLGVASSFGVSTAVAAPALPHRTATSASSFGMGIRIDGTTTFQFWNQYAGSNDVASSGDYNVAEVATSKAGTRALTFGHIANAQATFAAAKAAKIHTVIFNREQTTDCNVLTSEEATAHRLAMQQGITLAFAPTGIMLQRCYQSHPSIVANADIILYQSEAIQGKDPNYDSTVKTLVKNVKKMKPGIPVWVQVSVNPPANREIKASQVISTIESLENGSSGSPDVMYVFYSSDYKRSGRAEVMQQVIQAFRTSH